LEKVLIGQTQLEECPRCEGVWADADAVRQICARQEEQAAVLGMATATTASPGISLDDRIHYIPCPACHDLMNRVNFAHCSNVIVNVCSRHGTWVDKDQLRRIVEFIRDGGLEKSRRAELEELEDRKRSLEAKVDLGAPAAGDWYDTNRHVGIQAAVSLIGSLFDL
jgi:Zn-finger nucleic acid-binding protein